MRRRAASLAIPLAVVSFVEVVSFVAVVSLAAVVLAPTSLPAGPSGRLVGADVGHGAGIGAVTELGTPLAVLPVRTAVDDREVGNPTDPWRVLALCVVAALFVAARTVERRTVSLHPVRRRAGSARWVRFRAPPCAAVPALHG